jgi:hypothetical protein
MKYFSVQCAVIVAAEDIMAAEAEVDVGLDRGFRHKRFTDFAVSSARMVAYPTFTSSPRKKRGPAPRTKQDQPTAGISVRDLGRRLRRDELRD